MTPNKSPYKKPLDQRLEEVRDRKKAATDLQGHPEGGEEPAVPEEPRADADPEVAEAESSGGLATVSVPEPQPGTSRGAEASPALGNKLKPCLNVYPHRQDTKGKISAPTPGVYNLGGDFPEELKSLDLESFDLSNNTNGLLEIVGDGLAALQGYPSEGDQTGDSLGLKDIVGDPVLDGIDTDDLLDFEPAEDSGEEGTKKEEARKEL